MPAEKGDFPITAWLQNEDKLVHFPAELGEVPELPNLATTGANAGIILFSLHSWSLPVKFTLCPTDPILAATGAKQGITLRL